MTCGILVKIAFHRRHTQKHVLWALITRLQNPIFFFLGGGGGFLVALKTHAKKNKPTLDCSLLFGGGGGSVW